MIKIGVIFDTPKFRASLLLPDFIARGAVSEISRMEVFRSINETNPNMKVERYRPFRHYDAVVFIKAFGKDSIRLAEKLKRSGTKIIFDINVNYYERWGEYRDSRTIPTDEQMEDCKTMTMLADHVIARSTYLENICRKYNSNVTWVTDAVNTDLYRPRAAR